MRGGEGVPFCFSLGDDADLPEEIERDDDEVE